MLKIHEENTEDETGVFRRFCRSSTIHGTFLLYESTNIVSRAIWALIILMGIALAILFINWHNDSWQQHPVITSVKQVPIEEVSFPAITICPLDDNR